MAVDGINPADLALAQSNFKNQANRSTGAENAFGSLLADALSAQGTGAYSHIGKLVQKTGDPGAILAELLGASSGGLTQFATLGFYGALLGEQPAEGALNNWVNAGPLTASPSIPVSASITSDPSARSPSHYSAVINQFGVEQNPRYAVNQKGRGDTYCNIFVWDVTSAMNAEIPHYYNASTGEPMQRGESGAREMNANAMHDWLAEHGERYGWQRVSARQAQELANQGRPVVTALKRPGAHGHVQVVCPSKDGGFDIERGVTVAQAGSRLTRYSYISDLLGSQSLSNISYYAHM